MGSLNEKRKVSLKKLFPENESCICNSHSRFSVLSFKEKRKASLKKLFPEAKIGALTLQDCRKD